MYVHQHEINLGRLVWVNDLSGVAETETEGVETLPTVG